MKLGLQGKALIVTGAASGIGAAIARMLAEEGADNLILTDRDAPGLARIAAELSAISVEADLMDTEAPAAIAGAAQDRFGRIDGLVNAAGLTTRASFETGTPDTWDALFAVNARAGFFLMQAAIADMRQQGRRGPSSTSCR